ncbi:MAG: GPW/gp25 family protein [Akkermansiaceae bacterium]|nr:GPW/gp25 family protein [Akkermansiaceae bacterium]
MASDSDIPAFVGTGWAFPPEFLMGNPSVLLAENRQEIEQSLHILLSTLPGERVMQPKYGCDLTPLLFEPITTTLRTVTEDRVKTSIYYYEPRIEPLKVSVSTEDAVEGKFLIEVSYRIRANNTRHNFVFPFYREEGTETR